MRLFQLADPAGVRTVVVVGEGLLGSAISDRLRRRRPVLERHRATDWSAEPSALGHDIEGLLDGIEPTSVELFWTAGESGMQLPSIDGDLHRRTFEARLGALVSSADAASAGVRMHLASSAGALGPPGVETWGSGEPNPYAVRKEIEEDVVTSLGPANRVYRISSAYGAPLGARRAGVVGVLLQNALLGRETELFARPSTMRNYVHHHDVAEAMLRALDEETDPCVLLASQRSHAMSEVLAEVSRVVRRAVPVIHRPPANDHDMVFDPTTASPLLPQRSLAAGVRAAYDALLQH